MTVEEVRGSLDLTDNGAIKNSIRNCLTVFQNDPVLQGAVRYNILTERIDIVKPLWWSKQTATLTDTDLNYLMLYLPELMSMFKEVADIKTSDQLHTNALLATSFSSSCLEDRKYRLPHRIVPIPSDHVKPIK